MKKMLYKIVSILYVLHASLNTVGRDFLGMTKAATELWPSTFVYGSNLQNYHVLGTTKNKGKFLKMEKLTLRRKTI